MCATCSGSATNCGISCDSTCVECNTIGDCTSCVLGKFVDSSSGTCKPCDNTVCATCSGLATSCGVSCNADC